MARAVKAEFTVNDNNWSKVVKMGNVTEITAFERRPSAPPVTRLDKDRYLDCRTGTIEEYKHVEDRSKGIESIRDTITRIRGLINTNVTDPAWIRWVTLTYAENMTDTKKLKVDFFVFWKKLKRWCQEHDIAKPEYISVIEPQGRGAWHVHLILIWQSKAPYIDNNSVLWPMWGHGFTKIKSVNNCDNIGAYFSAYLADIPLDDVKGVDIKEDTVKGIKTVKTDGKDKAIVKGGRLSLYPPGMNIIRYSKGIEKPVIEWMSYRKAKEHVKEATLTYSQAFEILDDDNARVNALSKEYYNSQRKNGQ